MNWNVACSPYVFQSIAFILDSFPLFRLRFVPKHRIIYLLHNPPSNASSLFTHPSRNFNCAIVPYRIIITRLHNNLHTYYYLQSSAFRTFTNSGLIWLGNAPLLAVSAPPFVSPRFVSSRFLFTSYLSFGLSCYLSSFSLLIYLNFMYSSLPVHQHPVFFR